MIAYKLFRIKNNKLYPLYVLANNEVSMNTWLEAKHGEITNTGKVKSKFGELAYRPGWHCSERPVAVHIGEKKNKDDALPFYRPNDQVWCELEIDDTIDYQKLADKQGKLPRDKCLKCIPENGFYYYKTNPNMFGAWIIAGNIKINRILNDDEVHRINESYHDNMFDLPRK